MSGSDIREREEDQVSAAPTLPLMRDAAHAARLIERLYRRLGPRYVPTMLSAGIVLGLVTLAVGGSWAGRYLRLSFTQVALALALAMVIFPPLAALRIWRSVDIMGPVLAWARGERSPEGSMSAWSAAVRLPFVLAFRAGVVVAAAGVPLIAVFAAVEGLSAWTGVASYGAAFVALLASLVVIAFGGEFLLRPLVRDIAVSLPSDFRPSARNWQLGTKALLPLLPVTLFGGLMVGAYLDLVRRGPARLALALGIALGTVVLAGVVFRLVTWAVLEPVDELLAATRRVSAGDLKTPVPLTTADELGALAVGFNQMLASLRRHESELRASRARIVTAADHARRQVERDLHDGAQQHLVLLRLKLGLAERQCESDPSAAIATVRELRGDLERALAELRELAHGIYPAVLENEGVPGAIREVAQRAAIATSVDCDHVGRQPPEIEAAVYFCCLEALQNAAKHAGDGAQATVRLFQDNGAFEFEIADDGRGFDAGTLGHTAGIQNMTDRVGALGGTLQVQSAPGQGTKIRGALPVSD